MTDPSTDLVPIGTNLNIGLPDRDSLDSYYRMSNAIAQTEFVPRALRGSAAKVMACILTGRELGIPPMASLQHIAVIDGKPSLSGALMLAKMIAGGVKILEEESTGERARIVAERDGRTVTVEWTYEEAAKIMMRTNEGKKPLVAKDNWQNYRADMLWWRAIGRLGRRIAPDILSGMTLTVEEARDLADTEYAEIPDDGTVDGPVELLPEQGADGEQQTDEPPAAPAEPATPPLYDVGRYHELSAKEVKEKLAQLAQRPDGRAILTFFDGEERNRGSKQRSSVIHHIAVLLAGLPEDAGVEPAGAVSGPAFTEPATETPEAAEAPPEPPPGFKAPAGALDDAPPPPPPVDAPTREIVYHYTTPGGTVIHVGSDAPSEEQLLEQGVYLPENPEVTQPDEHGVVVVMLAELVDDAPEDDDLERLHGLRQACDLIVAKWGADRVPHYTELGLAGQINSRRQPGEDRASGFADFTREEIEALIAVIVESMPAIAEEAGIL